MPNAIETVFGYLSDAASTGAQAFTAVTGQTFTIRASNPANPGVTLQALFSNFQDDGDVRIRSPRMHDDVNGIRLNAGEALPQVLANEGFQQTLYSQDTLTVEGYFTEAPTATHISQVGLHVYYNDLPGIDANYRTWAEVQPNIVDYYGVPVIPSGSATAGQLGAGVALNSTVDQFKANTLYALLGYQSAGSATEAEIPGMWCIQGVDLGNLYVGGPIGGPSIDTRRFFKWMDAETGIASIPVINSQNKASTLVFAATQAASAAPEITLLFAQLSA
jgi:hypothetical protein